jgi:hypothetical protein
LTTILLFFRGKAGGISSLPCYFAALLITLGLFDVIWVARAVRPGTGPEGRDNKRSNLTRSTRGSALQQRSPPSPGTGLRCKSRRVGRGRADSGWMRRGRVELGPRGGQRAPPVGGLHLQFGADASQDLVVSWHTDAPVSNPRVMWGTPAGGLGGTVAAEARTYRDAASGDRGRRAPRSAHRARPGSRLRLCRRARRNLALIAIRVRPPSPRNIEGFRDWDLSPPIALLIALPSGEMSERANAFQPATPRDIMWVRGRTQGVRA